MASVRSGMAACLLVALSVAAAWSAGAAPAPHATIQDAPPEVGTPAPGFSLQSVDGEEYALEDLRGEAPLLLVFFRGVW